MNADLRGATPAFLAIQGLLEPEKRHAAEEQTRLRTERTDDAGPAPGDDDRSHA
jgi:hypothetical protein